MNKSDNTVILRRRYLKKCKVRNVGKVKKLITAAMISVMSLSVVGCNMIEQTAESKAKTVLAKIGIQNNSWRC